MTGRITPFRLYELGALVASIILAVSALLADTHGTITGFIIWAVTPFAMYLIVSSYLYDRWFTTLLPPSACITASLLLIAALFFYGGVLVGFGVHPLFLLIWLPLYLLVGAPVVLATCLGLGGLVRWLRR